MYFNGRTKPGLLVKFAQEQGAQETPQWIHNIRVQNQFYCYYSILQKSPNHIFIQLFIVAEGYCWLVSYDSMWVKG